MVDIGWSGQKTTYLLIRVIFSVVIYLLSPALRVKESSSFTVYKESDLQIPVVKAIKHMILCIANNKKVHVQNVISVTQDLQVLTWKLISK